MSLLHPLLGHKVIGILGEEIKDRQQGRVMRDHDKHILLAIGLLHLLDGPLRLGGVQRIPAFHRGDVEELPRPVPAGEQMLKEGAQARREGLDIQGVGGDGVGEREVLGGTEFARVVGGIAAHEDVTGLLAGIAAAATTRHPRQAAEVSDRVAGTVEEVEGSVTKVIKGVETADLFALVELDLA